MEVGPVNIMHQFIGQKYIRTQSVTSSLHIDHGNWFFVANDCGDDEKFSLQNLMKSKSEVVNFSRIVGFIALLLISVFFLRVKFSEGKEKISRGL